MKKNIGSADRVIRVIIAAVFVALALTGIISGTAAIVLAVTGLVLATTAFFAFCPVYNVLGLTTNEHEHDMSDGID